MDRTQIGVGAAALVAAGGIDVLAHLGPTGLVIGGIAAYVAYRHAPDVLGQGEALPAFPQLMPAHHQLTGKRTFTDRLLGRFPEEEETIIDDDEIAPSQPKEADDLELARPQKGLFTFSSVLNTFTPSLNAIYLATLQDGTPVYADAKSLCHVALAGATGNGKSSLIRLLMSQLCKAGASVLLLNPHYTHYDLDAQEDWTPFEPYLVHDPMECRKYEVIEYYLKQVATVLLPKRLEKYAHSQPTGKPYFIVIDELPAIVDNIPDAPKYLAKILREGRKVGIYLITAAQDFLVKTIAPQGGGAIRDCYRTAFYVGGDPITAKALLDIPANQIQENLLGKGVVMLRNLVVKLAQLVRVPYVDNQALYRLLGPSTYVASDDDHDMDDLFLERLRPRRQTEHHIPPLAPNPYTSVPFPEPEIRATIRPKVHPALTTSTSRHASRLTPELQRVLEVYRPGMTYRELGEKLGVGKDKAGELLKQLKERRGL